MLYIIVACSLTFIQDDNLIMISTTDLNDFQLGQQWITSYLKYEGNS